MAGSTMYAAQKTREAVNCLALLQAPIRERLSKAAFNLHILTADKIPNDSLQEKLEAIVAKVYENSTPDDDTLAHLSGDDVASTARQIVELFESCIRLYTQQPNLIASD